MNTKTYPSDVSDEEWQFVVPYLTLMKEEAPQRVHDLRQVFNAVRYWARSGCTWRYLPHDFPPWEAVYQQFERWLKAGVFAALVQDLRELLRVAHGHDPQPSACIIDSRTLQSTPESGQRGGKDAAQQQPQADLPHDVARLAFD